MNLLEPVDAHASTEPDGFCAQHPDPHRPYLDGLKTVVGYDEPRLWRVSGEEPVEAFVFVPGKYRAGLDVRGLLVPGTPLRLDSVLVQFYCDGNIHESTWRRFCVLDGDLIGHCLVSNDVLLDDHETHMSDPVEPLPVG